MTDYGEDIAGIDDFDAELSFVSGTRALVEALACRLGSTQGSMEDDSSWGYDLTSLIGSVIDSAEVARKIVQQMVADQRVDAANAQVTQSDEALEIRIHIEPKTGGPFSFVVTVDKASVAAWGIEERA